MKILIILILTTIVSFSQVKNIVKLKSSITSYPTFPYGNDSLFNFIYSNIKIPIEYSQTFWEFSGRIFVTFNIKKNGKVSQVRIQKSIPNFPKLDKEVIKVIRKLPNWIPATQFGKPIKVYHTLPIRFSYDIVK